MKTQDGARCDRGGESMDLPQTKDVQRRLQHRPRGTGAHVMNKHSLAIADPTGWPPHGKPPRSVQPGHKPARSSTRGRTRLAARRGMHSPAMPRGLPLRRAHAPCLPDRDELTAHGVDLAAPRSAHREHRMRTPGRAKGRRHVTWRGLSLARVQRPPQGSYGDHGETLSRRPAGGRARRLRRRWSFTSLHFTFIDTRKKV